MDDDPNERNAAAFTSLRRAEQCRARAALCRARAERAQSPTLAQALRDAARRYDALADALTTGRPVPRISWWRH
jgi:hypothetical protein